MLSYAMLFSSRGRMIIEGAEEGPSKLYLLGATYSNLVTNASGFRFHDDMICH